MLPVAYRVGMLAAALSSHYDGQFIGIMLTASHNALPDNGVKLVAPTGEMLPSSWEHVAEVVANCPMDELETELAKHFGAIGKCSVVVGMDTRPSGPALREMVMKGVRKLGGEVVEIGVVTTPELHTAVARLNREPHTVSQLEDDYIVGLASAFQPVVGVHNKVKIVVDCANGVGALKVQKLKKKMAKTGYELIVVNGGEAELNHNCGADYVKTGNCPPHGDYKPDAVTHFASLDGDADRLVYFTFTDAGTFQLIDGDRMSALIAMAIKKLLQKSGLADSITMGVVQTAYANGGSTEFIEKTLGIPIVCTPTGVKHLHKAASGFDIGIYFEANGHGTVLFSENATKTLRTTRNEHSELLLAVSRLANQLVGDGIADMLLVEAMLKITKQSLKDWAALYKDRPSCLIKTVVKDRTKLKTTDADRSITEPAGLQTEIDRITACVRGGRAFARPSGTEDVVRIFSEATTAEDAAKLAADISAVIAGYGI
ncbi:Phosphoacetylglucosamine mutase [Paramicrosporidium saccamoebae]|uniref:Phosphoacetylglucosamine mutase n=1 Tax=Paramicrosporidium saccamoebae TaxID=1246581 RepID=A0A2H9TJN4_9FUNG|nr:Phosphoacetylglucosamine mutase [Paramicrosporidium saccamoebae]